MNTEISGSVRASIIVPVRNEARYLRACLESILANDVPHGGFEVLVVDGRSDDGTRQIAESFARAHPHLRVVDNPQRIAAAALNRGLLEARGEVIIRIDGHGEVASDFIRKCVETLDRFPEAGCVGGLIRARGETFVGQVIALAQGSFFGGGDGTWYGSRKAGFVDTVSNGAYRRSLFRHIGLFDVSLVRDQDDEFNYRLRRAGYKIYLNPEITSVYYARGSLAQLAKQYFQYGFWKVIVFKRWTAMLQPRQFVPPVFVATLFLLAGLSRYSRTVQLGLGFLLGAYLISSLLAAGFLGGRRGWPYFFVLPVAFGAMHFGYGLGFWAGLVYFAVKGRKGNAQAWL